MNTTAKITTRHKQIFVNLSVADLPRSKDFFAALGYVFDERFTNEQAASMVLGDNLHVMLLTRPFFQTFTDKPLSDAKAVIECTVCLSCDSRAQVDELVARALAAGAEVPRPPQDHGFMYGHGFEDLDGHAWELVYMDMSAMPAGQA